MCSGKTTVGRLLARRLKLRFVDTDRTIELATGRTIPEIFRDDGEAAFRVLERDAIAEVCSGQFQVISTGGGVFVDPRNRDALRHGNLVVHLRVRPTTVVQRLQASRKGRARPLLEGPDPLTTVTELMAARQHAYAQAHVGIDVDDQSTYGITAELVRQWYAWRRARRASRTSRPAPVAPVAAAPFTFRFREDA